MSANIHQTTSDFDFSKVHLARPIALQGGSFHSKVAYSTTDEPLYIQTPQCITKQGVIVSGNKRYTDLMFTNVNNNFITWITNLEETLQQLIYKNRDTWFAADSIELDDIQTNFTPILKIYKGTNYVVRSYISTGKNNIQGPSIQIFNENEVPRDVSSITNTSKVICILEVQGIKFIQRSFHVTILIKQVMVLENRPLFNTCIINPGADQTYSNNLAKLAMTLPDATAAETSADNSTDESQIENNEETNTEESRAEESRAEESHAEESHAEESHAEETNTEESNTIESQIVESIAKEGNGNENRIIKIPTTNDDEDTSDSLGLVELDTENLKADDSISLKKPTEVYEEIYREARRKAIEAKKYAITAYLTANRIKELYSLEGIMDSDEDDLSDTEIQKLET